MPNLNIAIDEDLLRAIRVKAASEDMSRRDWVLKRLEDALLSPGRDSLPVEGASRAAID